MSKYLVFDDCLLRDRNLLVAALSDLGYANVEVGESLTLYGYQGDARPETAEVVVRRRHLGPASNDLGFRRTPDGYVPVISEYDRSALHGGEFLVKLRTAYSERVIEEVRRRLRGSVQRTVDGGVVKLRVRY